MHERIRALRKLKGLNQTEFGAKIGLSQRAVANIEQSGNVTERNFNAICKVFSVNPEWLREGVGEMFVETRDAMIQEVAEEFGLTPEETILVRSYLELPRESRAGVLEWAKNFAKKLAAEMGVELPNQQAVKADNELSPDEAADVIRQERADVLASAKRGTSTSSVSTGLNGTSKRFGNTS